MIVVCCSVLRRGGRSGTAKTTPGSGDKMRFAWIVPWLLISSAWAADPSALWNIDNGQCVPHMRQSNDPAPCSIVDLAAGYVVLKDIVGATQFLLMPTARISGIESPAVLAPDA